MTTRTVVIPTDGLIPITIPSARLHARRRGVTPPRNWRSSGRSMRQRKNSRTDSGTSTGTWDAPQQPQGCGKSLAQQYLFPRASVQPLQALPSRLPSPLRNHLCLHRCQRKHSIVITSVKKLQICGTLIRSIYVVTASVARKALCSDLSRPPAESQVKNAAWNAGKTAQPGINKQPLPSALVAAAASATACDFIRPETINSHPSQTHPAPLL